MIILYGNKVSVDKYFDFLNITKQFNKEVYCVYKGQLNGIDNIETILKTSTKVFICNDITSFDELKSELISYGCMENNICILNDLKMKFAYMMFDLNYLTANHKVLCSLLCNFSNFLELYSGYLHSIYNRKKEDVDVAFDFLISNNHTRIIDLSKSLEGKYSTSNYFTNQFKFELNNTIELNTQNTIHSMAQMSGFNNYKVLVTANAQTHSTATTVNILHNIVKKPLDRFSQFQANTTCDYNLIPTKDMFDKTKNILIEYKHLLDKEVCLIPFGSSKIDKLNKDLYRYKLTNKNLNRSICYAPASLIHNNDFTNFLSLSNGEYILETLLKNFKDYNIIFRPHPDTKNTEDGKRYVSNIVSKFSSNDMFSYDDSEYYMETFAKTELLISDFSSIGLSYVFSTLNPLLSISKKGFEEHYEKVFLKDDVRKDYSTVLTDLNELKEKVQYILDNKSKIIEKNKLYRDEQLFNFSSSVDYFKDNFEYILNKIKHSDWYYITNDNIS